MSNTKSSNAWAGRRAHSRHVSQWLIATYNRCPVWQRSWGLALAQLRSSGKAIYRGRPVTRADLLADCAKAYPSQVPYLNQEQALFLGAHLNLISLVNCLSQDIPEEQRELVGRLLLASNSDQAWERAVRHRIKMLGVAKSRSHGSPTNVGGLSRALFTRKDSHVFLRTHQGWQTRKGSAMSRVLATSAPTRRRALSLLIRLPGLVSIELPREMKFSVLLRVARQIKADLSSGHPLVEKAMQERREWNLAVRRIQFSGLQGLFDPATQTLIVDPRHLCAIRHELCHWLLGHDVRVATPQGQDPELEVHQLETELTQYHQSRNVSPKSRKRQASLPSHKRRLT